MSTYKGFDSVALQKPKRSKFDLSHEKRLTGMMGLLYPVLVTECMPSDTFRGSSEVLLRLAPLLAPIYDRIELFVHFFFVPNRLLWTEWEKFITGGRLGVGVEPVAAPIPPRFDIGAVLSAQPVSFDKCLLPDYMGVPLFNEIDPDPGNWAGKYIDAMPFLAYSCIWFNYYRDRNFISDDHFGTSTDGQFPPAPSGTLNFSGDYGQCLSYFARAWEHDYFTSALPFTQRGEEVLMPVQLGGVAPLYADPIASETSATLSGIAQPGSVAHNYGVDIRDEASQPGGLYVLGEDFDGTSTSINDFRSAYALQVWLERNAIGGSRYNESTQAHFGVKPQDSRLQRPEYIGGGKMPVQISEVLSTAWANDGTDSIPQANMAGRGITYGNTNQFNYFCVEHGFIIGMLSIMPKPSYHQGLPRMFRRGSFLDYPWPTFAKLGEQPVFDYELYATPASLTPDVDGEFPEFGFQSRYADWKHVKSTNHGDFHDTLLFWTLTRDFASAPVLGAEFVSSQPDPAAPMESRIFAVEAGGGQNFWMYCHNRVSVIRPLPYFGTPNLMGFQ